MERGNFKEFGDMVADLSDKDIEEFLLKIDKALMKDPMLFVRKPLVKDEYLILVKERQRRDEDGTSKEEG